MLIRPAQASFPQFSGLFRRGGDTQAARQAPENQLDLIYSTLGTAGLPDGFISTPLVTAPASPGDGDDGANHKTAVTSPRMPAGDPLSDKLVGSTVLSLMGIRRLVRKGADINHWNNDYAPVLARYATSYHHTPDQVETLFKLGASGQVPYAPYRDSDKTTTPFLALIDKWLVMHNHHLYGERDRKGMLEKFVLFKTYDPASLLTRNSDGQSALHRLCQQPSGHKLLPFIAPMLASLGGIAIDDTDQNRQTPLMIALLNHQDNFPTIGWLLEHGASMTQTDAHGLNGWDYASLDSKLFKTVFTFIDNREHPDWGELTAHLTARSKALKKAIKTLPPSETQSLKKRKASTDEVLRFLKEHAAN